MVTKTDKREAIEFIERLPDSISMETIVAELLFRIKVLRGIDQIERGESASQEEVEEEMRTWRL